MFKRSKQALLAFLLLISIIAGIIFAPSSYAYTYLPAASPKPVQPVNTTPYHPTYFPIPAGYFYSPSKAPTTTHNYNPNPYFNHTSPNPYFKR